MCEVGDVCVRGGVVFLIILEAGLFFGMVVQVGEVFLSCSRETREGSGRLTILCTKGVVCVLCVCTCTGGEVIFIFFSCYFFSCSFCFSFARVARAGSLSITLILSLTISIFYFYF